MKFAGAKLYMDQSMKKFAGAKLYSEQFLGCLQMQICVWMNPERNLHLQISIHKNF